MYFFMMGRLTVPYEVHENYGYSIHCNRNVADNCRLHSAGGKFRHSDPNSNAVLTNVGRDIVQQRCWADAYAPCNQTG
jgi:hypothetical protein